MNRDCCIAAGAVIVQRRFGDWVFLLLRSDERWFFPFGVLADSESLVDGVRRQAWEHASIAGLRFYWGHHYLQASAGGGDVVRYLLAESSPNTGNPVCKPDSGSACWQEHRWVDAPIAAELLTPASQPVLSWASGMLIGNDGTPGVKR